MIPKAKVNAQTVIDNLKNTLDLSSDMRPFLTILLGKNTDSQPWTLRGGTARTFASKGADIGKTWPNLTPKYQEWKEKNFPGKPLLARTGDLFRSLTSKESEFAVATLFKRSLIYGTTLPYAKYHMTGTKKMPQRQFMKITDEKMKTWFKLLENYLSQAMNGNKNPKVETNK